MDMMSIRPVRRMTIARADNPKTSVHNIRNNVGGSPFLLLHLVIQVPSQ